MKVISLHHILGTDQEVHCPKKTFVSRRFLLQKDNVGFTLTNTFIPKGGPYTWHYENHIEACYCISGYGVLTDLHTSFQFKIVPHTLYVLDKNDPHTFQALKDTELICIFNPPLKGSETHKDDGSYEVNNV